MSWSSRIRATAAAVVLALGLSSCGVIYGDRAESSPGVTDTTVTIGTHQPLTGQASLSYSAISAGMKAYFKYVNDHGGVHGRKIDFLIKDDSYLPIATEREIRRLVEEENVFAIVGGLGTPTHQKVVDYLNQAKVPDLFVVSGCRCWDQPQKYPYTFGWQPSYVVEGKILGQYINENFPGKRIAYFYQSDDFGIDGVEGLDRYIPPSQVVSRQSYEPGVDNVTAQVAAIAKAKADVVVMFTLPVYTALFRMTALKLGYEPQIAVASTGADPPTLIRLLDSFAQEAKVKAQGIQLIEGAIVTTFLPPLTDTSNSWIRLFRKVHATYIPRWPFDTYLQYGMALAYTFTQVLAAAGPHPTREGLIRALENSQLTGPGLVPLSFSQTSHAGFTGMQVGIIRHGEIALQGTPQVTDDGTGPIQPYTVRQPPAPPDGIPPTRLMSQG